MIRGKLFFAAGLLASLSAGWLGFPSILYEQVPQPLDFNHVAHTDKASMSCQDCHSLREDGTFSGIPNVESCAACHAEPMGTTKAEKLLVERYVKPQREIPWLVYSRQPENVWFSHAPHLKLAELECTECHGDHGKTQRLRPFERNRISGYSRDIWGASISRIGAGRRPGMKMDDCIDCHRSNHREHSCIDCHK